MVALNETHRKAIAAVAALVMHAARKAAHQMDTEIADFCLRERSRSGRPRNLGRIECAPIVLDPSNQSLVPALNLDDNLQTIVGGVLYIMMLATASSRHS
jgi:hypothetical protein